MDNLVVHVDRRAISFQRQLDDIDSAHNARAETSRPYPQQNFSIRCSWHCHPNELIPGDSIIPHGEPCPHPVSIRSPIFGRTLFPTFSMQICVESSGNWRRGIERRTHDAKYRVNMGGTMKILPCTCVQSSPPTSLQSSNSSSLMQISRLAQQEHYTPCRATSFLSRPREAEN